MKSSMQLSRNFIHSCAGAALLAVSVLAQAQQTQPSTPQTSGATTRQAQKADLKNLEQNGYKPGADKANYPKNIQNAENKAHGQAPASTPMSGGQ